MSSFLETIAASRPESFKEQEVMYQGKSFPKVFGSNKRSLIASMRAGRESGCGIIAELKRASPSHGAFAPCDIISRLKAYESAGVQGISILTEPRMFNGSFDDLSTGVDVTSIPILCKDFIIEEGQLGLASRMGASAALIIAKLKRSLDLVDKCIDSGLEPLLEIHDSADLDAIVPVVRKDPERFIVGINNRDLGSMRVDTSTAAKLAPVARRLLGDDPVIVGESGINSPADALQLAIAGVDGFLIGAAFMNTPIDELGAKITTFKATCRGRR